MNSSGAGHLWLVSIERDVVPIIADLGRTYPWTQNLNISSIQIIHTHSL